jgi:hypothetical protein
MIELPTASMRRRAKTWTFTAVSATLAAILAAGALAVTTRSARAQNGERHPTAAHASRTLNATDTAHLHYVRSSGSLLYEEGSASGTLPGRMRAYLNIGASVSATFTIYVRGGGTIKGRGTAKPHGTGIYESFAGSLAASGGTGRYAHAHGHGGLYGVFNRHTYAVTVQTTGRLYY